MTAETIDWIARAGARAKGARPKYLEDPSAAITSLSMALAAELTPLLAMDPVLLRRARRNKFVEMGRLA